MPQCVFLLVVAKSEVEEVLYAYHEKYYNC
jgi:hypothetical protein